MPTTNQRSKAPLIATAAALLGVAGFAGTAAAAVADAPPSILVFNQKLTGNDVSIDYAHLPENGYIVVYASDANGQRTGEPLGHVAAKSGAHMDLKVELKEAPKAGTNLWASIYKDKDGKEGFDRSGDKAVWSKLPMENAFVIK